MILTLLTHISLVLANKSKKKLDLVEFEIKSEKKFLHGFLNLKNIFGKLKKSFKGNLKIEI